MSIHATATQARAKLASLLNEVVDNQQVVIIARRGGRDVAMIAADELSGLMETAHLLRSPANADRLVTSLSRARLHTEPPQSIEDLRTEFGLSIQ